MSHALLYVLFFCSGVSGLIYQLAWVRQFGHAFGNTVHSSALVIAIFMLGLGVGGYVAGVWADRRYESRLALLRAYAYAEVLLALLGLAVTMVLPTLGGLVARLSSYTASAEGWQVLTVGSYLARAAVAVVLLTPITLIMGGTLTLLICFLVRADLARSGWTIALLYASNTAGAAAGAFLTDIALVPVIGLRNSQFVAVAFNLAAAGGAWFLARQMEAPSTSQGRAALPTHRGEPAGGDATPDPSRRPGVAWVGAALALSGCAAMGMEILWLRHATLLLGGFRAVFSLTMTVLLIGIGAGALCGGWMHRRWGRPAETFMLVQALFVATTMAGLALATADALQARGQALAVTWGALTPWRRAASELGYTIRPLLFEVGLPSFLAGCTFPLANAIVQRVQRSVGRRAGVLYLANTVGAVCGSLATGYALLPWLGLQAAAWALGCVAAAAIVPLSIAGTRRIPLVASTLIAVVSLAAWTALPSDYVLQRTRVRPQPGERLLASSEGMTEVVTVVEVPNRGRALITNGHAMSSTATLDQRYMRAMAHIPLLAMDHPVRALVIGFGVGNTTHAATLHPSVTRVDVVDLSPHVIEHASYFRDANRDVLRSPKVSVFLNDGRQHLQMTVPASYDLITLEPPPIAYAGVAALYSTEFYRLAQSRLTAGGYISQWLPAYQVPAESSLAMVRAFVDVFPRSVLLSGTQAELLLVGTNAPTLEIDPRRIEQALADSQEARDDLTRLDLGTPRDIIGTFVGSAETLRRATRNVPALVDDRPLQEYAVRSELSTGLMGVPSALFDLSDLRAWCRRCVDDADGTPRVAGLDLYFSLMQEAYTANAADLATLAAVSRGRRVMGSAYLGAVVPDSAAVHNILGVDHLRGGRVPEASREFEEALRRDPQSSQARANLADVRYDEGSALLEERRFEEASTKFQEAIGLAPELVDAHNNLGVALASIGRVGEALPHFRRAVALAPTHAEARRNLAAAEAAIGP